MFREGNEVISQGFAAYEDASLQNGVIKVTLIHSKYSLAQINVNIFHTNCYLCQTIKAVGYNYKTVQSKEMQCETINSTFKTDI